LPGWFYGAPYYDWGYASYANPFYVPVGVPVAAAADGAGGGGYDYSQPIDTAAAAPPESETDQAVGIFDQGRAEFKQGNYRGALALCDQALAKLPSDTALHEFRALVQFALGRYDKAAETLYAVLSVGPGWDWTTLIGLYPSIDVYTQQLRALEAYQKAHPQEPAPAFVLAYHYLTQGHAKEAAREFADVAKLQPANTLAAQLAAHLTSSDDQTATPPATPAAAESNSAPSREFPVTGTWRAAPNADTSIALTIDEMGKFAWTVTAKGKAKNIEGESTYGNGLLTLAGATGGTMVGRTDWSDSAHFTFKLMGGPPGDPGLTFQKEGG
jgi:tetratricopeptide (TPR) repeat protein